MTLKAVCTKRMGWRVPRESRERENGNIAILSVGMMVLLAVIAAVCIEIGCMYASRMQLDGALATAREQVMQPAAALQVEGADDPGAVLADQVVKCLRRNGQTGAACVWVYESTQDELAGKRTISYVARARANYHTMMLDSETFKLESMCFGTIVASGEEGTQSSSLAGKVAKYAYASNSTDVGIATTDFSHGPLKLKTIAARAIAEQKGK